jgi:anti-sigma regulatory factor (Ser/Thr protein kinase)
VKQSRKFTPEPLSVGAARRFATQLLRGAPAETLDAVELMVSELATNCIRHGRAGFEVTISHSRDQIRIEVTDDAGGTPVVRSPGPEEPSGRGLRIVESFSDTWGIEPKAARGKTVWFQVTVPAEHSAA